MQQAAHHSAEKSYFLTIVDKNSQKIDQQINLSPEQFQELLMRFEEAEDNRAFDEGVAAVARGETLTLEQLEKDL